MLKVFLSIIRFRMFQSSRSIFYSLRIIFFFPVRIEAVEPCCEMNESAIKLMIFFTLLIRKWLEIEN